MKHYITIICSFLLITASCANAQDLVILHTNDTHSQIEPEIAGPKAGLGGYERREEYIKKIRNEHKNVLLLDAGDFSQGTPYFNIYKGDVEIELMNALGYDAACLGNHEFDNGQEEIARRAKNAKFPILCANYDLSNSPMNGYIKPYTIIEKAGKKIGIIGLLRNVTGLVSPKHFETIKFRNPIKVGDSLAYFLKNDKGCDLIIALTHMGCDEGNATNPGDILLAKESENIDIIIGGHSHTNLDDKLVINNKKGKEVIVLQSGERGEQIGRLDLWF